MGIPSETQRRECQRFRVRPLDAAVGPDGLAAAFELLLELRVHREPLRHEQQLVVQRGEQLGADRRFRLGDRLRRDALRLLAGPAFGEAGLERLLNLLQSRGRGVGRRLGRGGVHDALAGQLLGVALADGGGLADALVHQRLRVRRLVALVVTVAAIADDVDHDVAVELVAIHHGEPDGRQAGLGIVGVDVDDRRVEALGEVARVVGGAPFARVGGEADLVVADEMDRAAGRVALDAGQVERLGHDSLAGEGRVAVDQDRQGHRAVVVRVRAAAARLLRARPAFDHRVHRFEMARVGAQSVTVTVLPNAVRNVPSAP